MSPEVQHLTDGWNEWSKHVLKELDRLNTNYEGLRDEIGKIHQDISSLKAKHSDVDDIKEWKKRMEDAVSPSQLVEMRKDVDKLKDFKARAFTVWVVLQVVISIIFGVLALVF